MATRLFVGTMVTLPLSCCRHDGSWKLDFEHIASIQPNTVLRSSCRQSCISQQPRAHRVETEEGCHSKLSLFPPFLSLSRYLSSYQRMYHQKKIRKHCRTGSIGPNKPLPNMVGTHFFRHFATLRHTTWKKSRATCWNVDMTVCMQV